MGENLRLYRTIMTFIGSKMRINDLRNRITFAWMVVGLIQSKRIHLDQWAFYRESAAMPAAASGRYPDGCTIQRSNRRPCIGI